MKKRFLFLMLLIVTVLAGCKANASYLAQDDHKTAEYEMVKKQLEQMLESQTFVFNATDMFPRGEPGIKLNYDCDVQIKDSMMISYLPFMGRSYNLTPGQPHSGFDFTQDIEEYEFKKKRKGYQVKVDVKNGPDYLKYTFYVTETGNSTLSVSSNQRQSISFYGTINSQK